MRLEKFITQNLEEILVRWEDFAASLVPAAANMSGFHLRDHAREILETIVKDISSPQTEHEQVIKSKGLTRKLPGAPATAAQTHGLLRATSGFEIKQMVSEYRALRASVLKLWLDACGNCPPHLDDIIRFNEAIDQALAESIDFFNTKVDERRNLFLGMLGHDMRTSLQAIQMTAMVLQRISDGEKVSAAAKRLIDSGSRMGTLLGELIEFNKVKLALGVRIKLAPQNMAQLIGEELDQIRIAYPERELNLQVSGPTNGVWDGDSLRRVTGNLVINAIKFGEEDAPIVVRVAGYADQMTFEVRNKGTSLDMLTLQQLFEPVTQASNPDQLTKSPGLGLLIAKQIVTAHGGDIHARCEAGETVFAVQLPIVSTQHPL